MATGKIPHLAPEAAATFAVYVDATRTRAAMEGRTIIYTIRFDPTEEDPAEKKATKAPETQKSTIGIRKREDTGDGQHKQKRDHSR